MVYFLYVIVCGINFGFYKPSVGGVTDGLYLFLLLITAPGYLRQRKRLVSKSFRFVEAAWVLFLLYFGARLITDRAFVSHVTVLNLRIIRPFVLFFPTVAILDNPARIKQCENWALLFAVLGSILVIAQSIYGLTPLFDGSWYNIGEWAGNKSMIGPIARVNIPIGNWVAFMFVSLSALFLVKKNITLIPVLGFLLVPILITYFRSLWLAIAISIFLQSLILKREHSFDVGKFLKITGSIVLVGIFVYYLLPLVGGKEIWSEFSDRLIRGTMDIRSSTGTFGSRINTIITGLAIWIEEPIFGQGYGIVADGSMPYLVDVGFVYILAMFGIIGLILNLFLFGSHIFAGIACANRAQRLGKQKAVIAGIILAGITVCFFIYQQWFSPYSTSILGIASAFAFCNLADIPSSGDNKIDIPSPAPIANE